MTEDTVRRPSADRLILDHDEDISAWRLAFEENDTDPEILVGTFPFSASGTRAALAATIATIDAYACSFSLGCSNVGHDALTIAFDTMTAGTGVVRKTMADMISSVRQERLQGMMAMSDGFVDLGNLTEISDATIGEMLRGAFEDAANDLPDDDAPVTPVDPGTTKH